jgi:hypothetical protein
LSSTSSIKAAIACTPGCFSNYYLGYPPFSKISFEIIASFLPEFTSAEILYSIPPFPPPFTECFGNYFMATLFPVVICLPSQTQAHPPLISYVKDLLSQKI